MWPNLAKSLSKDDSHLGYITKLEKETLPRTIPKIISKITTSFSSLITSFKKK
jgi:hypothetical protein